MAINNLMIFFLFKIFRIWFFVLKLFNTKIVYLLQKIAEIWLFEVLGVPGGPKISNPRKS